MKKRILILLAAFFVTGAYISTYIVRTNETVVVTHFGDPVRVVTTPGLKFKRPGPLSTVNRFKIWKRTFKTKPIQLLLGDQNPVVFTLFITWHIDDPINYFASFNRPRKKNAVVKLTDMINSQLGSTVGSYSLENIINVNEKKLRLQEIESSIKTEVRDLANREYGIVVDAIGIRRINYPKAVTKSVYKRMRSEREREAKRFRSEGKKEAAIIRNQARRKKEKILSKAYKNAQEIKGQADSEAIKIYAEAYEQAPEFYEFQKSLSSYRKVLNDKSTLVLSSESDFFKYLDKLEYETSTD